MSRTVTAHQAVALDMHAAGHSLADIKRATGLSGVEIAEITTAHHHDTRGPRPVPAAVQAPVIALATRPDLPAAAPERPWTADDLIAWGRGHRSAAVRRAADRAQAALDDLAHRRTQHAAEDAAQARVDAARAALQDAERALAEARRKSGPTAAQIRAWALANGHQLPRAGLIPRPVRDAYAAAHAHTTDTTTETR